MNSTYQDTVLDFDLNFLNQTTTITDQDLQAKYERIRRSVIFLKKKVLFSHSAVTRYKNARNYANTLENNQVFSKEGCKQHLISIKNLEEQVTSLKNELQTAENSIKEHNESNFDLQNKVEALNSHVNQLKVLLKEKNKIELTSVHVDKKCDKASFKDRARKELVEKENETLRKQNENLRKEIEAFRKGNATFLNLEKEIESLRKENVKIPNLEKEIKNFHKEYAAIAITKKVNETLRKENAKILNLEKENETLRKENSKISNLEKEIEVLRKENFKMPNMEKEIETLRKKTTKLANLEKRNETLCKENANIPNMEKEIATLLKQLTLMKKEKSKLRFKCNNLSRKYKSLPDRNSDSGDNSDADNDIFENSLFSPTPNNTILPKNSPIPAKDIASLESDIEYNEVVSVDTGRGSSLSYSDNEKCLHSPEYFLNDSPLNEENIENKAKAKAVSMETSLFEERVETAAIPVALHADNQEICESESLFTRERHPKLLNTVETSVSQINVTKEDACPVNIIPNKHTQVVQEKQCLELNNSNSMQRESNTDSEIEKILSTIKLNYNAISPIPRTPTRVSVSEVSEILRITEKVAKMERELEEVKKSLNDHNIKELLSKTNPRLTPQSHNESLISEFDDDHYNVNVINNDSYQTECSEDTVATQNFPIKDLIVNTNTNLEISDLAFSTQSHTDISQNQLSVNRLSDISLTNLHDQNQKQSPIHNHCVFEELTTDNAMCKDTDTVICPNNNSVEINESQTKVSKVKKPKIKRNATLEKLKKNLEPKFKIRRETPPLVKSRIKPKQLALIEKKVVPVNDTSASLNDKLVYEKAVKIMAEINSQQSHKIAKFPPKQIKIPLSPKLSTHSEKHTDSNVDNQIPQKSTITTRSKRKIVEHLDHCTVISTKNPMVLTTSETSNCESNAQEEKGDSETSDGQTLKKRLRRSSNEPEIQCKRILRSSTVHLRLSTEDNIELSNSSGESHRKSIECPNGNEVKTSDTQLPVLDVAKHENTLQFDQYDNVITYDDLDVFSEGIQMKETPCPLKQANTNPSSCHPKESILCSMLEKYGVETVRSFAKKVPDATVKLICDKIEQDIEKIIEVPSNETKDAMNRFVADLGKLNYKAFITGLMKYLTKSERKVELFGKVFSPPAPAMTKAEQVLLYVISHLKTYWPSVDIVDAVLSNIEYTLFKLNRTPEFDVIESTSHFYALLCRYFGAKSRLRLFILDAMYCIQFKSVPLIKQCLDVWMHIIPLAHMGIAKSPLVTCLVYLLHFYKCDDKFNRLQDIRNILSRKYFYQITDWNEKKILEMFKNTIKDLKDIPVEKKMLRLALIILAKRQGPRWCQNNIIKNLLLPMIEKETVPDNVKEFCVSMIGPLMKPYPVDMKVHCEIAINQLTDILDNNPSRQMEEAAVTSMMFINRHNQYRINQTLLSLKMKPMSSELEKIIRDYVKAKPLKLWKKHLFKIARS